MVLLMKTANEILGAQKCGDIFSCGDEQSVIQEYRQMAKEYHPDVCTLQNAHEIVSKLNTLYETALELIKRGTWEISNFLGVKDTTGRKYSTRYLKACPFELGTMYIADLSITYLIERAHVNFFSNAIEQIKAIRYASSDMENEISRYMPHIRYAFETSDGRYCLILQKTPDVFSLADVLSFYNGVVPDRHAAWIISRLCNLCCFFDYLGIAHNGLTLENCFISPQYHTVLLLGGWWYAKPQGERLLGMPRLVYDVMPIKAKSDKTSFIGTDLEASRAIGRKLLGGKDAPQAVLEFLNSGSSSKATSDFSRWNKTLNTAYGKRQFVEMNISKLDIYK